MDSSESLDELLGNWNSSLPSTLGYSHLNESDIDEITRSINEFYFGNQATPTQPIDMQALMNVSMQECRFNQESLNSALFGIGIYRQVSRIY